MTPTELQSLKITLIHLPILKVYKFSTTFQFHFKQNHPQSSPVFHSTSNLCLCSVFLYLILQTMAKNVAQAFSESKNMASHDPKVAMAETCAKEGVIAGAKAAAIASIATAIPTLASVRMLPWAKAHLNPTAQALIISTVAGAAYFIVADKTVLATARRNSLKQNPNTEAYEFN